MALNKQMEMFEEGGLMQEGGTVDPVSGNDVPVGSTQEEVRDDIPAQLSEGEFVMPADVVRYHGLDKMMALRDEAKAGLQRMDDMGQMGNSEEAVIPDGIPFDLNDLDIEDEPMEMQVGGFVQQPFGITQAANQPFQYQQSAFQNYVPQVNVPAATTPTTYTPVTQEVTPTIQKDVLPSFETAVVPTTVTYINDAGAEIQIPVDAQGNPLIPVPDGFKKKSETAVTEPTTPPVQPTKQAPTLQQQDSGEGNNDTSSSAAPKTDQFGREEDPRISQVTQSEQFAKLAKEVDPRGAIEKIKDDFLGAVGVSTTSQEYQKALNELSVGVANYTSDPDEQSKLIAEIRGNINQPTRSELGMKKAPLVDIDIEDVVKKQKLAAEPVKVETTLGKTGVSEKATVDEPVTVTEAAKPNMPESFGKDPMTGEEFTLVNSAFKTLTGSNVPAERKLALTQLSTLANDGYANATPDQVTSAKMIYSDLVRDGRITKKEADIKQAIPSSVSVSTKQPKVQKSQKTSDLIASAARSSTRNRTQEGVQDMITREGKGSYNKQFSDDIKAGKYDKAFAERDRFQSDITRELQQSERAEIKAAKQEGRSANISSRPAGPGEVSDSRGNVVRSSNGTPIKSNSPPSSAKGLAIAAEREQRNEENSTDSRVICTELHSQGKLAEELYKMDMYYTKRNLSETTVRGYHYWAIPMVPLIRKNNLVCSISKYLAVKRAEEIAHIINPLSYPKSTITGRLIKTVGEAICYGIGKFVKQKDYSVLYNEKSV